MTTIINKKTPISSEYSQHNDKFLDKLEGDVCPNTPAHCYNPTHPTHPTQTCNKRALEFILTHFKSMDFPRKISTKTTEGCQISVHDKSQALARFEQSNWLDCRISAYTELEDSPNFLFIDIDTLDRSVLTKVMDRCAKFGYFPTVLFTGSGYHIYQPVEPIQLQCYEKFSKYSLTNEELITQFLRVAADYISERRKDPNHYPSLNSCMVRIPGSINSKNGEEVKIIQEWDGKRPSIVPLLGIFYSRLASRKISEEKIFHRSYSKFRAAKSSPNKIKWIEKFLKTPLEDYRKTTVNLILAPYLVNIRRVENKKAFEIIKGWLELCSVQRKLNFPATYLINAALLNAQKTNYKPMRLDTLKQKNPTVYEILAQK